MRKTICSLVSVAALALAGCNGSSSPQPAAGQDDAAAPKATKVTGTVTLREPAQLSPQAKLVVSLVDVSAAPDAAAPPLASKTITPASQFPLNFELPFTPGDVNPNDLYVLKAELADGDRHYAMLLQAPVLTKGASSQVTIQLVAKQTPAEKELADFESVKKQLGGMKIKSDTKLEKDASRGWQIFRAEGQVKFIREQVDYGTKGFTDTDYAYKDGKPWVVVQQKKASQGASPSTTERAGWAPDGSVSLKQTVAGGKTTDLGDDEAGNLKQQAVDILKLATGGKGK